MPRRQQRRSRRAKGSRRRQRVSTSGLALGCRCEAQPPTSGVTGAPLYCRAVLPCMKFACTQLTFSSIHRNRHPAVPCGVPYVVDFMGKHGAPPTAAAPCIPYRRFRFGKRCSCQMHEKSDNPGLQLAYLASSGKAWHEMAAQ